MATDVCTHFGKLVRRLRNRAGFDVDPPGTVLTQAHPVGPSCIWAPLLLRLPVNWCQVLQLKACPEFASNTRACFSRINDGCHVDHNAIHGSRDDLLWASHIASSLAELAVQTPKMRESSHESHPRFAITQNPIRPTRISAEKSGE